MAKKRPPKTSLAFQDDQALRTPGPERDRLLAQMARMGAKNVRYNVIYGQTKGGTDLAQLDSLINDARKHGLHVQPTLMADPRYLNPTGGLTFQNNDPRLWAQFAKNVAQRERGRVQRYEIGNEPNYDAFVKDSQENPRQAGRTYRNIYRAAYSGIKGADKGAQTLAGGLTSGGGDPRQFLKGFLGGKPIRAAGFSYHPYQQDSLANTWDINRLGDLQKTLARYKRMGKLQTAKGAQAPLYLTEMGYQRGDMPEQQRIALSAAAYRKAQRAGARQFLQYQLTDKTPLGATPSGYGATPRQKAGWDTSIGTADGNLSAFARALKPRKLKKR